jgi:antitoxin HigA-1
MRDSVRAISTRQRCPRHPGYILKTLYLQPLSLTISQLAAGLSVSRKTVSAIVNERKSITPEMALRLAQAFPNTTPESWLNLQRNYDIWNVAHTTSQWKTIQAISDHLYEPDEASLVHL